MGAISTERLCHLGLCHVVRSRVGRLRFVYSFMLSIEFFFWQLYFLLRYRVPCTVVFEMVL